MTCAMTSMEMVDRSRRDLDRRAFTGARLTRARFDEAANRLSDLAGLTIRECDVDIL